ncbi:hypothetical protein C8K30_10520 [Promicromonospora sp. AC04]|uniref:type IV toxin-antitoxin system AbiEi family antitoxin domain-containing protein n=1 Tax=Promicromonospora sp. AC04 TaxID=2135723 RepID=UPI000D37EBAF|nr:type IV toxin-antitoxin system AbiEi family antitoxin domain-containing protein [Promicromonospora sp. AC04]PUB26793.1 hypothetical protein C8K30_10520 [Promicromonospora sp. AC04]
MHRLNTVPQAIHDLAARQEGLVAVRQCYAAGVDRRRIGRLVEHGVWRREGTRLIDTDPTPPATRRREDYFDHIRRRAAVKGLLVFPGSGAVGAAALALHGVSGLPRHIDPEVSFPRGVHRKGHDGVIVRQYGNFRTQQYRGWRIAQIEHALAQGLPGLTRDEGVAALSSTLHTGQISHDGLATVRHLLRWRRGSSQVLGWTDLASRHDESPAESSARLSCIDNAVPPDRCQAEFWKDGKFLARCDFAWLLPDGRWLVVEIDGVGPHSTPEALVRDAPRQNALLATGRIVMLRFKPADNDRPGGIGAVVAARLQALGRRPTSPDPPPDDVSPNGPVTL